MTSNVSANRDSTGEDYKIPENATIREEYVSCGNVDCRRCIPAEFDNEEPERQRFHGPYIYAYWKEGKKLRKGYVGKSWKDFEDSRRARAVHLRPAQYKKFKYIREEADSTLLLLRYLTSPGVFIIESYICWTFT